jgi:threonine dehydrogenase-like Zn-dependent dehydrogenase
MGSPIPFDFGRMQLREISVLTSTGCPGTMEKAVALIAQRRITLDPLMTHVYEGKDSAAAFDEARGKNPAHVKSFIHFSG